MENRFFKIEYSENWIIKSEGFHYAKNHAEAIKNIDPNVKRVFNDRYREIERTGKFYYVTEEKFNGKCLIFETLNNEILEN